MPRLSLAVLLSGNGTTLENLFETLASETTKVLKVVVKADTQGSVEAIVEALKKIESEKVVLEIIHSAVGSITESDVLAATNDAGKLSETDLLTNSSSGRNAYHAIAATTRPMPIGTFFFISFLLFDGFSSEADVD